MCENSLDTLNHFKKVSPLMSHRKNTIKVKHVRISFGCTNETDWKYRAVYHIGYSLVIGAVTWELSGVLTTLPQCLVKLGGKAIFLRELSFEERYYIIFEQIQ
jgi:hypothetical protein